MKTINDLPIEVLFKIFDEYLDFVSKAVVCQVSHHWREVMFTSIKEEINDLFIDNNYRNNKLRKQ